MRIAMPIVPPRVRRPRRRSGGEAGLWAALGGYGCLVVLKLVAWWLTGVFAMLAEALHTLSDFAISAFLLVATYLSRRPADAAYRYGYGRVQHVAALVAATVFISFTGFRLVEASVIRLLHPPAVSYERLGVAVAVLVFSMLAGALPIVVLRGERGPTARAQFLELLNDEAALGAALVGTLLVARGYPLADALASLVVGLFIILNAVGLLRENARVLIGRAPSREFFASIQDIALGTPPVKAVHDLRAQYVGPERIHLSIHVEVDPQMTVAEGEDIASAVREAILAGTQVEYCVVHVDPLGAPPEPDEFK